MRFRHAAFFFSILLVLMIVSACDSDGDNTTTEAPQATDAATEVVAEITEEAEETDLPTEEAPIETQEPSPTQEEAPTATQEVTPISNVSPNGNFSFNLFDVLDAYTSSLIANPPSGVKWVLLDMVLSNQSSNAITVGEDALIAVDRAGNRYQPELPNDATQPSLVGAEIPAGEGLRGFVIFGLPTNEVVVEIQWCPANRCTQPLTLPLELEG